MNPIPLIHRMTCTLSNLTSSFIAVFTMFASTALMAQSTGIRLDQQDVPYTWKGNMLQSFNDGPSTPFKYLFSEKQRGEITSIHPVSALKTLVFYGELNQVVTLDNRLAQRGQAVNLEELNLENVVVICASYDNGLWVYDNVLSQLIRFDRNMKETNRSQNLNQILRKELQPLTIVERGEEVYLLDDNLGVLQFDLFGNYQKITLASPEIIQIRTTENGLHWLMPTGEATQTIYSKNIATHQLDSIPSIAIEVIDFDISFQQIALWDDKKPTIIPVARAQKK